MNIYFCGIGGVGLGPLAQIARDAGHTVYGSDLHSSTITEELTRSGIVVSTDQSGANLEKVNQTAPLDWFIYTSALSLDHPELTLARELGLHIAKRDELINYIVNEKNLKLIAIAGTHGKTTTTAMAVWILQQLGIPVSYSIGTTISFGPSGYFDPSAQYFVYECDEFDRNFLHFSPYLSLITSIDFDHPDTYPTQADYAMAFTQFLSQSQHSIIWARDTTNISPPPNAWQLSDDEMMDITLAGSHNRANATLVVKGFEYLGISTPDAIRTHLATFPGSTRRFERLADNLYSDYGHHPVEIAATLQMARELSDQVVLVYQPHQNTRQHNIRSAYTTCMALAEQIYWLPTFQTREDPSLSVLTPEQLTEQLANKASVTYANLNDELWQHIQAARTAGKLVLCMGAGTIDSWVRQQLTIQR
ncbi:MAG: Mur ligase domain-containing protein [Candidatus Saccharimonas sp.]